MLIKDNKANLMRSATLSLVILLIQSVNGCPFINQDDALISQNNQFQRTEFQVAIDKTQIEKVYSLGFWSFGIPQMEFEKSQTIENQYDFTKNEDGQLLILIKNDKNFKMVGFLSIDKEKQTLSHKFIFFGENNQQLIFDFPRSNYEGVWIFTFFTFQPNIQIVQIESQNKEQNVSYLTEESYFIVFLGGKGNINELNLNTFRGRISKLIVSNAITYNENLFYYYQELCAIPQVDNNEQTIEIINGLKIFDGDIVFQNQFQQWGNNYQLTGWIKFNFQKLSLIQTYPLLRLSTRKNYQNQISEGDEILQLYIIVDGNKPEQTKYFVVKDYHTFPLLQKFSENQFSKMEIFCNPSESGLQYFYGLQQWHFLRYYYQELNVEVESYVQLQFFNDLGMVEYQSQHSQLKNSMFFMFVGGDYFLKNLFIGSIYGLTFKYNYKNLIKHEYFLVCHYSCLLCDGPLETNCLACSAEANREYQNESQKCLCQSGYFDMKTLKCVEFKAYLTSIEIQEIEKPKTNLTLCQYNYFELPQDDGTIKCVKCPQINYGDQLCLDCVLNPQNWYLESVCKSDLITQNFAKQFTYLQRQREIKEIDVYFINKIGLLYLFPEYSSFCTSILEENCILAKNTHLGKQPIVKCKPNYFIKNGECTAISPYCIQVNSQGKCTQTIDGMYYQENKFYECPIQCQICVFDEESEILICKKCIKGYSIIDNNCEQCGDNCSSCTKSYDKKNKNNYLLCQKCIDNSKYFLSFDAQNCLKNPILNCEHAFQVYKSDYTINTYQYQFQPIVNYDAIEEIETICAKCSQGYVYLLEENICVSGLKSECYIGYSNNFSQIENQVCIFQDSLVDDVSIMYKNFCTSNCLFCATCILNTSNFYVCLQCENGYYSELIQMQCKICPEQLHCYSCLQQQKYYEDGWKFSIRAFYKKFIELENTHPYILNAQSQNIDYYDIICQSCNLGYELYQNLCIKACPKSCFQCQIINNENICVQCPEDQQGRKQSLVNNECIECPQNCALCLARTSEELLSINPLFNNNKFQSFSYKCLKSFDNEIFKYDKEFNIFVDCQFSENCQKILKIPMSLYCSEKNFFNSQEYIFIDDLVSGLSFKEFENDYLYQFANQNQISKIIIVITSKNVQTCTITRSGLITQQFSSNIFTAINVEIQLNFSKKVTFKIEDTLTFSNFSKIQIQGLIIKPIFNENVKQILFNSVLQQIINLDQILLISENFDNLEKFQIETQNITQLMIQDFLIQNMSHGEANYFFFVTETKQKKIIQIRNLQIINSSFQSQDLFLIHLNLNDSIEFYNVDIFSNYSNSSFLNVYGNNYYQGEIRFENFQLSAFIQNSNFLNIDKASFVNINLCKITYSDIINTTLFFINNNASISEILIENCTFQQNSIGLTNSKQLLQLPLDVKLFKSTFSQNEYDQTVKLISFIRFNNLKSSIIIEGILISNNYNYKITNDFNTKDITASLFYFSIDFLVMIDITINRGYGLTDISLNDVVIAQFTNISIKQGEKHQFLGLHQFLDCQLQQVKGQYFGSSISMFSVQNLLIKNILIQNAQTYNSPIISFVSQQIIKKQIKETIQIINLIAESNLILVTEPETTTSILRIESQQQSRITLFNLSYSNNILHHYIQDFLHPSGLLIMIENYLGDISINNSIFYGNQIYNSTDSIIQISCKQLALHNCIFNLNNVFNYTTLQPYLLWGYVEEIFEDDIIEIFPISSESGNGLFIIEKLNITNCDIFNSSGSNGAGFKILALQQSQINVQNIVFQNLKTHFTNEIETGGCLHIDGSSSLSLQIFIQNISISNVSSRYMGGFLYFLAGDGKILAEMINLKIVDPYSQIGSIFSIIFSGSERNSQFIILKNIQVQYTNNGAINYFDLYYQASFEESEKLRLFNNKTLFYFQNNGLIHLENISLNSVFQQSLIYAINIIKLIIKNVVAFQNNFSNNLIFIQPNQYAQSQIYIKNLNIKSSSIGTIDGTLLCNETSKKLNTIFFKCLSKFQQIQSPFKLKQRSQNKNQNFGKCQLLNSQENIDQSSSGFIQFISLNSLNQITISDLKMYEINCTLCKYGLIHFNYIDEQQKQLISNLWIQNSYCGGMGCFNIFQNSENKSRVLQNQDKSLILMNFGFKLKHYTCFNNFGNQGTCLFVRNVNIFLSECNFQGNYAEKNGGAIYIEGKKIFMIEKSMINKNQAEVGGGLYLKNQNQLQFFKLTTMLQDNVGQFFGNNIASIPDKLILLFGKKYFPTKLIFSNSSYCLAQTQISYYLQQSRHLHNEIFLPSGQEILQYQIFDWKNRKYISPDNKFRLLAINSNEEIIKNLNNSFCFIKSRQFNISSQEDGNLFTNNYTNFQQITFNETSQDYNMDNLIINFDSELPDEIILQLEFNCSSIFYSNYSANYPYLIENNHNNYHLRINIRSYACQLGEIKNYTDYSCKRCDGQKGLFSLKNNSVLCNLKDDISTISVTSAQLNLKPGYWRPYLDSDQVSFCKNLNENCNGGWIEGDVSCYKGHIGALCEQCDLYNIRGDGMHSVSKKYQCGSCNDQKLNATLLTLISIWTIISILISVQSNLRAVSQYVKTIVIHKALLRKVVILEKNQSSILIKMLTNYFQIISAISTFELNVPKEFSNFISAIGSPISAIVYSLDCFLINIFQIEIIYARLIWQLIMPLIYLIIFIITYQIGTYIKVLKFQRSFLATTLIFMYIYMQQNLIGNLIELLSYREISGFKWILANVSYRYDTFIHYGWILQLCLPMLLVLALLIPIYFFQNMFRHKNQLDDKNTRNNWGYLYNEYKKKAYFWEIVKILKKELIIIFLTYYQQSIVIKGTIVSLILIVYLELNQKFQPYSIGLLNQLDYTATIICISSYILALAIFISQQMNFTQITIIFVILICLINFNLIYLLISKIVIEYIKTKQKKYQTQIQKIQGFINGRFTILKKINCIQDLLKNKSDQKQKIQERYQKLRCYLITQAKNIIAVKSYNTLLFSEQLTDKNIELHLSQKNVEEKQQIGRKRLAVLQQMMYKRDIYTPAISSMRVSDKSSEENRFL